MRPGRRSRDEKIRMVEIKTRSQREHSVKRGWGRGGGKVNFKATVHKVQQLPLSTVLLKLVAEVKVRRFLRKWWWALWDVHTFRVQKPQLDLHTKQCF